MSAQGCPAGDGMARASGLGSEYLLVEECFAHGPGNGAGLRTGDGGFGHGGRSAAHRVSACAISGCYCSSSTHNSDSMGAGGSNNRAAMSFEGGLGEVETHENQSAKCRARTASQPVPKAVRGLAAELGSGVAAEF